MSGGRVELGLGTGWYEAEHTAYGVPFPPLAERFERLEEQLAILTGLWRAEEKFSYDGRHYRLVDAPPLPKPVQSPHPPVIIGGRGRQRTPRLAATYADEFNLPFASADTAREQFGRVRAACESTGRELTLSAALVLCCGRDEQELARRAAAIGRDVADLRATGAAGTPAEVVATLRRYAEAGATRAYLQVLDLSDLEHLALVAERVLPELA
jgi:alkanesulfonate monooxygenase